MEGSSGRETASEFQVSLLAARGPAQYHGSICSAGGGGTGTDEAKTTCSLQQGTRPHWLCYGGSKHE